MSFKRPLKLQFPLPYKATDPASLAVVIFFFNAVMKWVLITRRAKSRFFMCVITRPSL
uniref:Uncharacterized protein n=1 Tax=Anguilla anguilla TaxID=7936 RepID=A0A0E9PUK3_ANGAN